MQLILWDFNLKRLLLIFHTFWKNCQIRQTCDTLWCCILYMVLHIIVTEENVVKQLIGLNPSDRDKQFEAGE